MHPILFKIGNLTIYTYGTILYIDILASLYLLSIYYKKFIDTSFDSIFNSFIILLLSMYLGGKIGYSIFNETSLDSFIISTINPFEGGLTIIGAIFGGILGVVLSAKIHKLDTLRLLDAFSFIAPFSIFIGRIGCLMAGCCYGKPSTWGIELHGCIRYPTQLFESILSLFIFIYFLYSLKGTNQTRGIYLFKFLILYGIVRFFVEYFRESQIIFLSLSLAQIFSLFMITTGLIGIILLKRKGERKV